jgi:hypothetical protein
VFCNVLGKWGFLVPRFLGFEAKLVPGHVGAYRCPGDGGGLGFGLGCGDGGGLGFGRFPRVGGE